MSLWGNDSPLARWNDSMSGVAAPAETTTPININPDDAFRGDQGASKLLGEISRAQWEDWKSRFSPYIKTLGQLAQDTGASWNAAAMAKESVGTAFDASQRGLQMQRQGMGVNLTPQQRQAESRANSLERTGAMVSAGNQARISAQDRQQAILAGGMGLQNIPDRVLEQ